MDAVNDSCRKAVQRGLSMVRLMVRLAFRAGLLAQPGWVEMHQGGARASTVASPFGR